MELALLKCDIRSAKEALSRCIPGGSLSPDDIYEVAQREGYSPAFKQIASADLLSKEALFDAVFSEHAPPSGKVFVLADGGLPDFAFSYEGSRLREAVLATPEFLFDGDLLFVWPNCGRVSVFHHEGGCFHVHP